MADGASKETTKEQVDVFTRLAQWILLPLLVVMTVGTTAFLWILLVCSSSWSKVLILVALLAFGSLLLFGRPFFAWTPPPKRARDCAKKRFSTFVHEEQRGDESSLLLRHMDWIIVGSGIGGLTCGAVLSLLGQKVCVLEAHEVAGGSTHEYHVDGKTTYKFPSGLHYVIPHCQHILQVSCGALEPTVRFRRLGNTQGFYERIRLMGRTSQTEDLEIRDESQLRTELHRRYPELSVQLRRYEKIATQVLTYSPLWMALHLLPWKIRKPLMKLLLPSVWWNYAGRSAEDVLTEIFSDAPPSDRVNELQSYLCALWVDTVCPPQRASFFMSAAVALGFPHEGGVYPDGGPEAIGQTLVERIEASGGHVLVRAPVHEILVENNKAVGVRLSDAECGGRAIRPKRGVITACGWRNTSRLLPETSSFPKLEELKVPQGDGFVMANIGIKGSHLNLECCNLWPQPGGDGKSIFQGIQKYLEDPLGVPPTQIPMMITFPSVKDRTFNSDAEYNTAQMLALAKSEWFGLDLQTESTVDKRLPTWKHPERSQKYTQLKSKWKDRLTEAFLTYYPQLKGKLELFDVSTPLTIEHYLPTGSGSAIGLDVIAGGRFTDLETMQLLDMKTPIDGLWMTGQDTLLIGVPLAQAAGLITALRISGPWKTIQFLLRSMWILFYTFCSSMQASSKEKSL